MSSSGDKIVFETRKTNDNWKKIQERTFTNWFNDRLRGHLRVAKKQVSNRQLEVERSLLVYSCIVNITGHGKVCLRPFACLVLGLLYSF